MYVLADEQQAGLKSRKMLGVGVVCEQMAEV